MRKHLKIASIGILSGIPVLCASGLAIHGYLIKYRYEWLKRIDDPGIAARQQSVTSIDKHDDDGVATYRFHLKEKLPQEAWYELKIQCLTEGESTVGFLPIIGDNFGYDQQNFWFDAYVAFFGNDSNSRKQWIQDFTIEVKLFDKKLRKDVWKTTIYDCRFTLDLESKKVPDDDSVYLKITSDREQDIKIKCINDWTVTTSWRGIYDRHPSIEIWDGYTWLSGQRIWKLTSDDDDWHSSYEITIHLCEDNDYTAYIKGDNSRVEPDYHVGGFSYYIDGEMGDQYARSITTIDTIIDEDDANSHITLGGTLSGILESEPDADPAMPTVGCLARLFSPDGEPNTNIVSIENPAEFLPHKNPEGSKDVALKKGCFEDMFKGCSGLTNTPIFTYTTLEEECYKGMFSGCSSLGISQDEGSTMFLDLSSFSELPTEATLDMFADTKGPFTGTPTFGHSYYY